MKDIFRNIFRKGSLVEGTDKNPALTEDQAVEAIIHWTRKGTVNPNTGSYIEIDPNNPGTIYLKQEPEDSKGLPTKREDNRG